jgi:hypothetical protein
MKAFPFHIEIDEQNTCVEPGMDLRDYFAAQIISGFVSNPAYDEHDNLMAERAYGLADLMMEARNGKR